MAGCAVLTAIGSRVAALALVALALAWLRVDQHVEGAILVTVDYGHGLTEADLLALPALALAAWRLRAGGRRRRRRGRPRNPTRHRASHASRSANLGYGLPTRRRDF
jgi:hypothetical protein